MALSWLQQSFVGHMPGPLGSLLAWQAQVGLLVCALLALLARAMHARRRRVKARVARVLDEIAALKQRLRWILAEPSCPFADVTRAGPVSGMTEAFEKDLEAAARSVLIETRGRRSAAKELLRQRLRAPAEPSANGDWERNVKAATRWRQLGALSLLDDTSDALRAYARAAELAPEEAEGQMLAGVLQLRAGNLTAAEVAFQRQIAVSDTDGARAWRYRGFILLGDVHAASHAYPEAVAAYAEAQREVQTMMESTPNQAWLRRDLSVTFDRLGDAQARQGALDAALASYRQALEIVAALAAGEPNEPLWLRDQSVSHDRIGDILDRQGNFEGALESFERGLRLAQRLASHDANNVQWQWDLSISHDRIGDMQLAMGRMEAALQSYRQSLAIAEGLAASDPSNIAWHRDLAISYHKVGSLEAARENPGEARDLLQKGRGIIARLERIAAYQAQWRADLAKFDRDLQGLPG
jgi:tetratricopeptide (TPR) repeat protein